MREMIEMLESLRKTEVPSQPGTMLVDLQEAFGLFAEKSEHRAALPHLLQKSSRRFGLDPTKVVYREEDASRFFDGSEAHLQVYFVLLSAGLIPRATVVKDWKEVGPSGQPIVRNGRQVTRKPRLAGLDLSGLDFENIRFEGVDFFQSMGTGVNFRNCVFVNCRMNNTKFAHSSFRGARFSQMGGKRKEQGHLRWANLAMSDLSDTDFSGCDIREVNFSGSKAQGADFRGANAIATKWYGVTGAPIVEAHALRGESKFSYEMRGSLLEDDVEVCHRLPEEIAATDWARLPEDTRQRLVTARLVEKGENEIWRKTDVLRRVA